MNSLPALAQREHVVEVAALLQRAHELPPHLARAHHRVARSARPAPFLTRGRDGDEAHAHGEHAPRGARRGRVHEKARRSTSSFTRFHCASVPGVGRLRRGACAPPRCSRASSASRRRDLVVALRGARGQQVADHEGVPDGEPGEEQRPRRRTAVAGSRSLRKGRSARLSGLTRPPQRGGGARPGPGRDLRRRAARGRAHGSSDGGREPDRRRQDVRRVRPAGRAERTNDAARGRCRPAARGSR